MSATITGVTLQVPTADVPTITLEAWDRGLTATLLNPETVNYVGYGLILVLGGPTIGEFVAWFESAKSTLAEMRA